LTWISVVSNYVYEAVDVSVGQPAFLLGIQNTCLVRISMISSTQRKEPRWS